jgi:hypothetical protein
MRRTSYSGLCPVSLAEYAGRPVSVLMDRSVPKFILEELAKHPNCEEGGKYLGFVENDRGSMRIVISDFLPGGPNAKRTRVEFLPDGDFQEGLFRQAERLDSRVEHLGSWHSHHCNGLGTFSEGDIAGYFKTVNKAEYRPDFFVASLVTRIPRAVEERDWLQHFLFARADDQFYRLDDDLRAIDAYTTFGQITGHSVRPRGKSGDDHVQGEATASADGNLDSRVPRGDVKGLWYESEVGRSMLARDRLFFGETFGAEVKATRKDGRIKLSGTCRNGSVITITYPLALNEEIVDVILIPRSNRQIDISCHLADRLVAVRGTLCMENLL